MRYTQKVNKVYVTPEELEQLVGMFKWAVDNDEANVISFKMFKQYDKGKKEYNVMYEVWCQEWNGQQHQSATGHAGNTLDAMAAFSKNYQVMKEAQVVFKK